MSLESSQRAYGGDNKDTGTHEGQASQHRPTTHPRSEYLDTTHPSTRRRDAFVTEYGLVRSVSKGGWVLNAQESSYYFR